jgi:membrane protease YdiL (CAAX protease family)
VAGARGIGLGSGSNAEAVVAIIVWQLAVGFAEELYYRGLVQSALQSGLSSVLALTGETLSTSSQQQTYFNSFSTANLAANSASTAEAATATETLGLLHAVASVERNGGFFCLETFGWSDAVALLAASALFGAAHMPWAASPTLSGGPLSLKEEEEKGVKVKEAAFGSRSDHEHIRSLAQVEDDVNGGVSSPPSSPPPLLGESAALEWFLETGAWGLLYGAVFAASSYHLAAPLFCHASQNIWWCLEDVDAMGIVELTDLEKALGQSEREGKGARHAP